MPTLQAVIGHMRNIQALAWLCHFVQQHNNTSTLSDISKDMLKPDAVTMCISVSMLNAPGLYSQNTPVLWS